MSGTWGGGGGGGGGGGVHSLALCVVSLHLQQVSFLPGRIQHMAISMAPVAPGNLDILLNAAVYPFDPQLSESELTLNVRLG